MVSQDQRVVRVFDQLAGYFIETCSLRKVLGLLTRGEVLPERTFCEQKVQRFDSNSNGGHFKGMRVHLNGIECRKCINFLGIFLTLVKMQPSCLFRHCGECL